MERTSKYAKNADFIDFFRTLNTTYVINKGNNIAVGTNNL